jgi:hypothetical protein
MVCRCLRAYEERSGERIVWPSGAPAVAATSSSQVRLGVGGILKNNSGDGGMNIATGLWAPLRTVAMVLYRAVKGAMYDGSGW